jgi:hypothetical protein
MFFPHKRVSTLPRLAPDFRAPGILLPQPPITGGPHPVRGFLLAVFCGTGDGTQVLELARPVLHY